MIHMSISEAARLLGSEGGLNSVIESGTMFTGISTDSRMVKPGMLFAALAGQNFDGHDYIDQAIADGAVAVIVSRDATASVPVLQVEDMLAALATLAKHWRQQCPARCIGITGSNGKTTVKEMVASILRQCGTVLATDGNFNNELGLPLTIFRLDKSHDYAVIEMGANKPGDIAYLADIAMPEVGLVNNIGPAHLEGFGSVEGVARAKGELYAALPEDGTAIMNFSEPWLELWKGMNTAGSIQYFNGNPDEGHCEDDQSGEEIIKGFHGHVTACFEGQDTIVTTPVGQFKLALPLPGGHNLTNALAATAACLALDVSLEDIKAGLETVKPVPGRLNLMKSVSGWTVIDDTYNANPASLYAALQVLSSQEGEPWLVLGDMKELGSGSRKMHAELGEAARIFGVRRLFALGEASQATVDAFGEDAYHFENRDALIKTLSAELHSGVACLVKGSRSMGMEHVVSAISSKHTCLEALG
jgi:UDP-N-acetylmuramoyl-tripeptide--D-alanyl-D-alanine ligase